MKMESALVTIRPGLGPRFCRLRAKILDLRRPDASTSPVPSAVHQDEAAGLAVVIAAVVNTRAHIFPPTRAASLA